ncbi:MAG: glycine betaine ABC transporter substrate-binding protein [Micrococcaceae bacterium]
MNNSRTSRISKLAAAVAVVGLTLTACGEGGGSGGSGDGDKNVHIGYVTWDEVTAATYLWQHILEDQGYTVELTQLEPAAVYAGVGQNDTDLYMGGLRETHRDYWDRYGENFEGVAEWYAPLRHGLVVPEYVDAETIEDLEGNADEFGGRIIGIEPGSGLMQELEQVADTFDLSGYEIIEGSSAAMLAEFERAIGNEAPIVAAAWNPHWAVGEYNMKFLDDSSGLFVDGDMYTVIASEDAQEDDELMELLSGFEMNDDQLYSLLNSIREAGSGNEMSGVEAWLEEGDHQDVVDGWVNG